MREISAGGGAGSGGSLSNEVGGGFDLNIANDMLTGARKSINFDKYSIFMSSMFTLLILKHLHIFSSSHP